MTNEPPSGLSQVSLFGIAKVFIHLFAGGLDGIEFTGFVFDFSVTQLDGGVAIGGFGFNLGHNARPGFDDGDGNRDSTFCIKDLGHAEFCAEDTYRHFN